MHEEANTGVNIFVATKDNPVLAQTAAARGADAIVTAAIAASSLGDTSAVSANQASSTSTDAGVNRSAEGNDSLVVN